jgi:hypothetical protein
MDIYLAARFARFPEMQGYALCLKAIGHTVTSRWIRGDHEVRAHGQAEHAPWHTVWAHEDIEDLMSAHMVVSFTEAPGHVPGRGRGGRHVEMGIALATQKRCVIVGYRENIFHWLEQVEFYATWDDFYMSLCVALC